MRYNPKAMLFLVAGLSGISCVNQANSADLPGKTQNYTPAFTTNWAGVYGGLHLGYGTGRARSADIDGFIAGIHGGVNFQIDRVVVGGELDLNYAGVDFRSFTETFRQKWLGSGRVRLGYAFERFLPFVTAGVAYSSATMKAGGGSATNGHLGFVVGVGGEMMITDKISSNIQLLHYRFGAENYSVPLGIRNTNIITNEIRIGLNYRF